MKTETSLLVVRDGEEESRKVTRLRKCHEREPGRVGLKSVSGRQAACMKIRTLASTWDIKAKEGRLLRPDWLVSWGRETAGETGEA